MDGRQSILKSILVGVVVWLVIGGCSGGGGGDDQSSGGGQQETALASALISAATGGVVRIEAPHRLAGSAIEAPAGALAADTTISIYEAARPAHARALDVAIEIEPGGLSFATPVVVRLVYNEADLPEQALEERLWIAKVASDGSLIALDDVSAEASANMVSGKTASLSVFVVATNSAPMADAGADQRVSVGDVVRLDGGASHDADGDALTYRWRLASAPEGSAAAVSDAMLATASFQADVSGVYRAELIVDDGLVESAPDVVSIDTVNSPPAAHDDAVSTAEDTPAHLSSLLANDVDVDGDALHLSRFAQAGHGVVVDNADGTLTYTPAADFSGADAFTYWVSDGVSESNGATVTIVVTPVNDAPVAVDDAASVSEDGQVTIDVLANDSDADGDGLTVSSVTQAQHGVVVNHGSSVTYRPAADFNGSDSFAYRANDGVVESNGATVTIVVTPVNDAPVAVDDAASASAGEEITIDVLANDSDADGDGLTVSSVTQAQHGVVVNHGSSVTYRPAANYTGSDSFSYRASDGAVDSNAATVAITVTPPNSEPELQNVLLILADDIGVDILNAYDEGADFPQTPTIDRLADEGVLFRNAWATPKCSSTRATILTGRYGFRNEVMSIINTTDLRVLSLNELIIPEVLSSGAQTHDVAMIGKWHLGSCLNGDRRGPNLAGFSHFAGSFANIVNRSQSFFDWRKTVNGSTSWSHTYATTDSISDAVTWIRDRGAQPWFLYLPLHAPHEPWQVPPHALVSPSTLARLPQDAQGNAQSPGTYCNGGDRRICYMAMVEAMDAEIGRLLASIPTQVLARTTVIFVGDNGTPGPIIRRPFDGAHGKSSLYEGGINVPLIVHGAGVVNPNRESAALVNTTDLFATTIELATGQLVAGLLPADLVHDSVSMVPILKDQSGAAQRAYAYSEVFHPTRNVVPRHYGYTMRNDRYKFIRLTTLQRDEFYDLQADPHEQNNLLRGAMDAGQTANYQALLQQLAVLRAPVENACPIVGDCSECSGCVVDNAATTACAAMDTGLMTCRQPDQTAFTCPAGQTIHTVRCACAGSRSYCAGKYDQHLICQ